MKQFDFHAMLSWDFLKLCILGRVCLVMLIGPEFTDVQLPGQCCTPKLNGIPFHRIGGFTVRSIVSHQVMLQYRDPIIIYACLACHPFSHVQVASCSSTVMPILAQDLALAPNQTQLRSFQVYVESAAAANLSCVVTLLDSQASPSI